MNKETLEDIAYDMRLSIWGGFIACVSNTDTGDPVRPRDVISEFNGRIQVKPLATGVNSVRKPNVYRPKTFFSVT